MFKVKIICVKLVTDRDIDGYTIDHSDRLEVGKCYEGFDSTLENKKNYLIHIDSTKMGLYPKELFRTIDVYRNDQIDKII